MILSRHPVTAAMYMIVSMLGVAALFVLLDAFFLAVLQVLVYAGAVMVLFLFIIMLLDVGPQGAKSARLAWLHRSGRCRCHFSSGHSSLVLSARIFRGRKIVAFS